MEITEFPLDKDGKPLAWPCPNQPTWYVDAWNGIYDSRTEALAESRDWIRTEAERVLAHGEDIVSEEEFERRLALIRCDECGAEIQEPYTFPAPGTPGSREGDPDGGYCDACYMDKVGGIPS